jgi:hypothetical protein
MGCLVGIDQRFAAGRNIARNQAEGAGHRQTGPWAGDIADVGAALGWKMCLADIKFCRIYFGSPAPGLALPGFGWDVRVSQLEGEFVQLA